MKDVMIDLETLGTNPNCPVISIGAVFFDISTGELGDKRYWVLDFKEQMEASGRKPDADTIKWWMLQDSAAKKVFKESPNYSGAVLIEFISWFRTINRDAFVWGNGATFDISIMENLFKNYNLDCPWKYNKALDLRTFKRFVAEGNPIQSTGVAHNALDDAVSQAEYVMAWYKGKL